MNLTKKALIVSLLLPVMLWAVGVFAEETAAKPGPDEALALLKQGNERFASGRAIHPCQDRARLQLAGTEDQGDFAFATVIGCSDSRAPVELIFDAGVMEIFTIRVAGNVVDANEAGSVEYGAAHVKTPVVVILGHTQCGAVTAATRELDGRGRPLERNIQPLLDNIFPAIRRSREAYPNLHGDDSIPKAIEENVWQAMTDLFMISPEVRRLAAEGRVKVVGAIYDLETGRVAWLPEERAVEILALANKNPDRVVGD